MRGVLWCFQTSKNRVVFGGTDGYTDDMECCLQIRNRRLVRSRDLHQNNRWSGIYKLVYLVFYYYTPLSRYIPELHSHLHTSVIINILLNTCYPFSFADKDGSDTLVGDDTEREYQGTVMQCVSAVVYLRSLIALAAACCV